jgi:AraC family transcriptional regulator
MSEVREHVDTPRTRGPRLGLGVELRRSAPGAFWHGASEYHWLSVHAGDPVRVTCAENTLSVRTRGEISVIPAGTTEGWIEDDAGDTVDLRLSQSLMDQAAAEMGLDSARAGVEARYHFRDAQIEHLTWALAAEHRAGFPNGLVYVESLGMALAVHLLARYRAPAPPRGGLSPQQLARVTEYIEAHLAEDVSLLRLSRVAAVSASHLRALFKRSLGVTVHEYVIQRRVERARELLTGGELRASEVARAAGFAHQSHMARCMRRVLGVTPTSVARARA